MDPQRIHLKERLTELLSMRQHTLNDSSTSSSSHSITNQEYTAKLESLLQQWHDALENQANVNHDDNNNNKEHAETIESMMKVYKAWLQEQETNNGQHSSFKDSSRHIPTNKIFRLILQLLAQDNLSGNKKQYALQVFNDWNQNLGGHLELAPSQADYHLLLQVFAQPRPTLQHYKEDDDDDEDVLISARVAMEILQHCKETGYSLTPMLETYAWVTECLLATARKTRLSKSSLVHSQSTSSTEDEEHDWQQSNRFYDEQQQSYARQVVDWTHQVMEQPLLQKYIQEAESQGNTDAYFDGDNDKFKEQLLLRFQILCNAIICTPALSAADKTNPQQVSARPLDSWRLWLGQVKSILRCPDSCQIIREFAAANTRQADSLWHRIDESVARVLQLALTAPYDQRSDIADMTFFEKLFNDDSTPLLQRLPTMEHLNANMLVWKNVPGRLAKEQRQLLLQQIHTKHSQITASAETLFANDEDAVTRYWDFYMMAHYQAGHTHRVKQIWKEMQTNKRIKRSRLSFSIALQALADIGDIRAAQQATGIWNKTLEKQLTRLTSRDYASVMVAWARSRNEEAAKMCRLVMNRLREEATNDPSMKPRTIHYCMLVAAHTSDASFTPDKAQKLLEEMEKDGVQPDEGIYRTLLSLLSRIPTLQAAETAEAILQRVNNDTSYSMPSIACYVSTMFAWGNVPQGHVECERLLLQLEQTVREGQRTFEGLDSTPYIAMIDAYTRQNPSQAGYKADKVLEQAKIAASTGIARPIDKKLYSSVMMAHYKSHEKTSIPVLERLRELVYEMENEYESGNFAAKPDAHSFTVLLLAYARSPLVDKATLAWNLLNENMIHSYMHDGNLDLKPTAHAFVAVLSACLYTTQDQSKQAVRIALQVMDLMREAQFEPANSYVYNTLFKVIGSHMLSHDPERERLVSYYFQQCCAQGQVNASIINTLRDYLPEMYKRLPANATIEKLPQEWSRHGSKHKT